MSGTIDFKPAFQVEKVTGKFTRTVMHIDEEVRDVGPLKNRQIIARKMRAVQEEFTDGYMVYFPQGHSILIAADDEEQLRRVGVLEQPHMVDMNSGEVVPVNFNLTPKEIVARKEANRPRAHTGGFTALDKGDIE